MARGWCQGVVWREREQEQREGRGVALTLTLIQASYATDSQAAAAATLPPPPHSPSRTTGHSLTSHHIASQPLSSMSASMRKLRDALPASTNKQAAAARQPTREDIEAHKARQLPAWAAELLHRRRLQPAFCAALAAACQLTPEPTPLAVFLAILSTLERGDAFPSAAARDAAWLVLATVTPHVAPQGLAAVGHRALAAMTAQAAVCASVAGGEEEDDDDDEQENGSTRTAPSSSNKQLARQLAPAMGHVLASLTVTLTTDAAFPPYARAVKLLWAMATTSDAKTRRAAHEGLACAFGSVHASAPRTAVKLIETLALELVLPPLNAPAAAVTEAQHAKGKAAKARAEESIANSVAAALHALGALKACHSHLPPRAAAEAASACVALLSLRQPYLTRHATDMLLVALRSPSSTLSSSACADLASILLEQHMAASTDPDGALRAHELLLGSLRRCVDMTSADARGRLRVHELSARSLGSLRAQMASAHDAVARGAAMALAELIGTILPDSAFQADDETAPATEAARQLQELLTLRYSTCWTPAATVASALFNRAATAMPTKRDAQVLCTPVLRSLGDLVSIAEANAAAMETSTTALATTAAATAAATAARPALEAAIGAAVSSLGLGATLETLPLELDAALLPELNAGGGKHGRAWMLPIIERHVTAGSLREFSELLLPDAELSRKRADALAKAAGGPAATKRAVFHAVEIQIWSLLAPLSRWCTDVPDAFTIIARPMGERLQSGVASYRTPLCRALSVLCNQHADAAEGRIVHADYSPEDVFDDGDDDDNDGNNDDDDDDNDSNEAYDGDASPGTRLALSPAAHLRKEGNFAAPDLRRPSSHFTAEHGRAGCVALAGFAKNFLPILFNLYMSVPVDERRPIGDAIGAYARVSPSASLAPFFSNVLKKLLATSHEASDATMSSGDADRRALQERRASLFALATLLLQSSLPDDAARALLAAARPALSDSDASVQKRSYAAVSAICSRRGSALFGESKNAAAREELQQTLESAASLCKPSARRWRISALLEMSRACAGGPEFLFGAMERSDAPGALFAAELVLTTKEPSAKTRAYAFGLLVKLARACGAGSDSLDEARFGSLLRAVAAGLAGSSQHAISASVVALARLLHAFPGDTQRALPRLLPTVLLLLRTRSREVVKSVLEFAKVAASRSSVDELNSSGLVPGLPEDRSVLQVMCEGLLLWHEDSKNRFKMKVRVVIERLHRRLGREALDAVFPEEHKPLLRHIHKETEKKRKRRGADDDDDDDDDGMDEGWDGDDAMTEWRGKRGGKDAFGNQSELGGRSIAPSRAPRSQSGRTNIEDDMRSRASSARTAKRRRGAQGDGPLARIAEGDDFDLLGAGTARALADAVTGRGYAQASAAAVDGDLGDGVRVRRDGRMEIRESFEERKAARRQDGGGGGGGGGGYDDDSMDGGRAPSRKARTVGGKSLRSKPGSTKSAPTSLGGRSRAGTSYAPGAIPPSLSGRSARTAKTSKSKKSEKSKVHDPSRFRAKNASGDVPRGVGKKAKAKGEAAVEPYAYWPLDARMLNGRKHKRRVAQDGLHTVMSGKKSRIAKKKR